MPVALLPPLRSCGDHWQGQQPLLTAPRYIRGRLNSRWHRIRSATHHPASTWREAHTTYHYWCGPFASNPGKQGNPWLADELPAGEPACGTCVGRALGAGQDDTPDVLPPLRFDPRWIEPPALCPGSRSRTLWTGLPGGSCGQCLACGDVVKIYAIGRGYNAWGAGPVNHPPGNRLVDPCPFHSWQRLTERDGSARCGCGYPDHPTTPWGDD